MPRLSRLPFIGLVLLCVLVALYASVYYLPLGSPENMGLLVNNFGFDLLAVHAGVGSVALVVGPFQFLKNLRARRPRLHHFMGRSYVLAVVISGTCGLVLAIGTTSGPLVTVGFGTMAIAWVFTALMGVQAAIQGRYDDHRAWMYRSFAVTLSAVSLRLFLPAMMVSGVDFELAYPLISYACWIPNLVIVEIWLVNSRPRTTGAAA